MKNIRNISSFHTTQYDLNKYCGLFSRHKENRFHTTQYDLNFHARTTCYISVFRFHTTQYDLNRHTRSMLQSKHISFHTTQYDLNIRCHSSCEFFQRSCFHTTQYDLNLSEKTDEVRKMNEFPYYIVRFKQSHDATEKEKIEIGFHTTQYDLNFLGLGIAMRNPARFHTTQYDLNEKIEEQEARSNMFPYYIVRFKQKQCVSQGV